VWVCACACDATFGSYTGLRSFGTNLINHVTLKVRKDMGVENIMLVDSPGMIDSPVQADAFEDAAAASSRDRGYDFPGVIQWFAERADVILLFFDPDKPVRVPVCVWIWRFGERHAWCLLPHPDACATCVVGGVCWDLRRVPLAKHSPA